MSALALAPLILVPLSPLLAAILILLLRRGSGALFVLATGVSLGLVVLLTGQSVAGSVVWLESGPYSLTVGLSLDPLSYLLALLVAGVGLVVGLYALAYMKEEAGKVRFYSLMSLFIGAMLTLVLSNSLIFLFAAWEGVGVASYALIGFWYRRDEARAAARKAFLITRLGDLGLLLGLLLTLLLLGTTDIPTLLSAVTGGTLAPATLTLLALLFFLGAVGKSAQLPLTAWLPDAMAGPTPVSALLHSATMVAAGVYLLLRLFPLLEAAPGALSVLLWTGALTALFAALVATVQTDIKRVLAWSTVSQLGEMVFALGLGGAFAAAFHLTTHATFKATLFLTAGVLGHVVGGYELRKMGGLAKTLPLTALAYAAAGLTLAGVPPFSAFWSEEAILAQALTVSPGWGAFFLLLIFLAGVYVSRAGVAAFGPWQTSPEVSKKKPERPDRGMVWPTLLLALVALGLGWLVSARLGPFLGLEEAPPSPAVWTVLAVAASVLGLALGSARAWRRGPVPTFGAFPNGLEAALTRLTQAPAIAVRQLAYGVDSLEHRLDRATQTLARAVRGSAGGLERLETQLDAGARALATGTVQLAAATGQTEQRGFSDGLDSVAESLGRLGKRLQGLESGKLYLYTLSLFVWVCAAVVAGILVGR